MRLRLQRLLSAAVLLSLCLPARAHVILFMDPSTRSLDGAMPLVNIDVAQEPTGFLDGPGDVQYVRFEAEPGQVLFTQAGVIIKKRGALEANPTLVVFGPGLPDLPSNADLPFAIPAGQGAVVLEGTERIDFQDAPYGHFLVGPEFRLTMPGGTYNLAVFDRQGKPGEYKIPIGEAHAGPEFLEWQLANPDPFFGDLNGDEKIEVTDAILALQFAVGMTEPTARQRHNGDVSPGGNAEFVPGDNTVDVSDAIRILRRVVDLEPEEGASWP